MFNVFPLSYTPYLGTPVYCRCLMASEFYSGQQIFMTVQLALRACVQKSKVTPLPIILNNTNKKHSLVNKVKLVKH
jgi:hypothetical protein